MRAFPLYAALAALTIVAGLASRRFPHFLPAFVARYAGDTLWAAMVFWLLAMLWPRARTRGLAIGALGIAVGVEISQLYHAGWIDAIRQTRLGALALGSGFLWSDLACYAVGVGVAAGVDRLLVGHDQAPPASTQST
ncbi:MAG: DUF2809 domain-containing protein [Gemmatimonadales bacterium]|nr:DUF2809 domain-containing protein [Gemmatimonadales bacterium]